MIGRERTGEGMEELLFRGLLNKSPKFSFWYSDPLEILILVLAAYPPACGGQPSHLPVVKIRTTSDRGGGDEAGKRNQRAGSRFHGTRPPRPLKSSVTFFQRRQKQAAKKSQC